MPTLILPGDVVKPEPVEPGVQKFLVGAMAVHQQMVEPVARGGTVDRHVFDDAQSDDVIELSYSDGFTHPGVLEPARQDHA